MNHSKTKVYTGWALTGLSGLFLLFDAIMKLVPPDEVKQSTLELGFPEHTMSIMGVLLLASTILYLIPRTAYAGAVLLTGYLGGAIAAHLRVSNPVFSHTLFPLYIAVMVWAGLLLRHSYTSR